MASKPEIPKLLSQAIARKLLIAHGWKEETGGKHVVKMVKAGRPRPITLPYHKGADYGPDLRAAILREAGLN